MSAIHPTAPAPRPAGSLATRVYRARHFYYFVAPFFVSFAILGLWPLVFSLYLAFVRWDGLTPMVRVGLGNFQTLWEDTQFWDAILNTVYLFAMYVPPMLILAFLLAVALNGPVTRFRAFFRAAVFLPCVTPIVVVAIVFSIFCTYDNGLFNYLLQKVGLPKVGWQQDPIWTRVTIAILLVWRWTGYNMVFMLAGLQGISGDVYEAARIDGASRWQTLTRVTLPLMRPTFVFCAVMSLLGTVYMFEEVLLVDRNGSAQNLGVLLFANSFTYFKFGYASAMAYVVAVVVFTLTMLVRRFQKEEA
jgi:cellobiose transport system permease protein